ncbi:MAG: YitT family protein, partial [Sediminibacterium sp.]|nr:YitT family protein [Sediminibacterium sp.]
MKAILKHLITKTVFRQKKQGNEPDRVYSNYELAKGFRELRINFLRFIKDILFMTAGIGSAAFGLKSFLLPNNFIDGGATGISLLVSEVTGIPLYFLLILINIPFVFLGANIISKNF